MFKTSSNHDLGCLDHGTPFLCPLSLGVGVPSPDIDNDLHGRVPISLPNFSLNGQGTMAAEAPLALGPVTRHLGDVLDLILPDPSPLFRNALQFQFHEIFTKM